MATESIGLSAWIPASPVEVFAAWLDSTGHSAMTGSAATVDPRVGGKHTAWDGYIEGETLEFDPGARIVQSWRTNEFPPGSAPSRLELTLVGEGGGTRLLLAHSDIPAGQGGRYKLAWVEFYFEPMIAYFKGDQGARARKARAKKTTGAKRAAKKKAAIGKKLKTGKVGAKKATQPAAKRAASRTRPANKTSAKKKPAARAKPAKKTSTKKKAAARAKPAKKTSTKKKAPRSRNR